MGLSEMGSQFGTLVFEVLLNNMVAVLANSVIKHFTVRYRLSTKYIGAMGHSARQSFKHPSEAPSNPVDFDMSIEYCNFIIP